MPVTIRNTGTHRVVLRLNSGRTCPLPPGREVAELSETEVRGNAHVERLRGRGAIAVERTRARRSGDLTAREAAQHIRDTPVEELEGFLSDDEDRKTVLDAWETKHDDT